ncbi:MAG: response regulator, partial [Nitrospirota bacterium]|nr:response regulator [Nitrospirota bacterium]
MMDIIKTEFSVRILLVDDEENILRSIKRLLNNEDFETLTANSGDDALKILDDDKDIAIIISDQRMPGMTGVDFLEKAKELAPDSLRILLTGYADINAVADAINRGGAYRYLTKPWNDYDLVQVVKEAARRYLISRENKRLQETVNKQNQELKNWNTQLYTLVEEQTLEIQNKNRELENLCEDLKKNFKNMILSFSCLLELRDKGTGSHSRSVAELSVNMARKMNLADGEIETIVVAALLHDIGKIGMSDVLLLMDEEKLDEEGLKEFRKHP